MKGSSRSIAATVLARILAQQGSLSSHLAAQKEHPDYALLQEMCFGACRWWHLLSGLLERLLSKPLKTKDNDIQALLVLGLYQLRELSIPDHAVLNETVGAANLLGKSWARPLINGVLRNYQRNRPQIEREALAADPSLAYSHPGWLLEKVFSQWPDHAHEILQNANGRPPMTLRVNLGQVTRERFLDLLRDAGNPGTAGRLTPSAVYLAQAAPVQSLPGFREGWFSVQDEASQLVPGLLALGPGQRVLDACAAPGGKTCHILESEHSLAELVAIDNDSGRLGRLEENLARLGSSATVICQDAASPEEWWDGKPFQRILLDAPCSATGVIRRHPDIKLLRSEQQIRTLTEVQAQLLASLWPCLEQNGLLLYTSCSILRDENEAIIDGFLQATPEAKYQGITADWGVECRYGRQLLTGAYDGTDGFFYALLKKE